MIWQKACENIYKEEPVFKNRHWKKYLILLVITLPVFIVFIFMLPHDKRPIALGICPSIFWILYYTWIAVENRKKRDRTNI